MCDDLALAVLAASQMWTSAYWFCLIVGGGLLLVSALGTHGSDTNVDADGLAGGDLDGDFSGDMTDGDFDVGGHVDADGGFHEMDVPVDAGVHHGGVAIGHAGHGATMWLSSWFSTRFVVFGVATFGAVGVIMTHVMGARPGLTVAIALVSGAVVGQAVHQLFRSLRRSSGNSAPRPADYIQKLARVTIAIKPPDKGEVAIQVRGTERYVPAITDASDGFAYGDNVVVTAYRGGVAEVISRETFERQYRAQMGGQA